jgi:hypothetical protein
VQTAERAVASAERDVQELRMQLSALPDPLHTLIEKRPDLSATITKLHAVGFDMRIADDIRDPDGKPMLLIGERDTTNNSPIDSPTSGLAVPTPARQRPTPPPSTTQPARQQHVTYDDPATFRRGTPEAKLQKKIDKRGGTWHFPALFDTQGRMVPAKREMTQYGMRWMVYDNPQLTGKPTYISDSKSASVTQRMAFFASKGYRIGTVEARAQAIPFRTNAGNSAIPVRLDNGFDPNAPIVEVESPRNYVQRVD